MQMTQEKTKVNSRQGGEKTPLRERFAEMEKIVIELLDYETCVDLAAEACDALYRAGLEKPTLLDKLAIIARQSFIKGFFTSMLSLSEEDEAEAEKLFKRVLAVEVDR